MPSDTPCVLALMSIQIPSSLQTTLLSLDCISGAPRFARFALSISASSFITGSRKATSLYLLNSFLSVLPSRSSFTSLYTPCTRERITVFLNLNFFSLPSLEISIRQEKASLSTPGLSEQIPLLSSFGSMGNTLSAIYTLVPRVNASLSSGEPSST